MVKCLYFWFLDDVYAIGAGKSNRTHQALLKTHSNIIIFKRYAAFAVWSVLVCVYRDFANLGSGDFLLNSIPGQLHGKCLSTRFFVQVLVKY